MSSSPSPFGQNEWLVEEMYRKFREDPSSVDPSWHEFLVDYSPEPTTDSQAASGNGQPAPAPRRRRREPAPAPAAEGDRRRPAPPPRRRRRLTTPRSPRPTTPNPRPPRQAEGRPGPRARRRRRGTGAARRRRCRRQEHVGVAGGADRDQRAGHPGQADDRQPHRHQQPPQAHPRRQDLVHPPDRLRAGAGGQEVPEHEPPLRRGGRQAQCGHARTRQPRPGDRPAGQGRQPPARRRGHQERPRPCGSASSSPPTRTSCGAPATAS